MRCERKFLGYVCTFARSRDESTLSWKEQVRQVSISISAEMPIGFYLFFDQLMFCIDLSTSLCTRKTLSSILVLKLVHLFFY